MENLIYISVKIFGAFIRVLPINVALWIGRRIGLMVYYFDIKHKSIAYGNLKIAFAKEKSPGEIRKIAKQIFKNYGQNLMELLRLPLMTPDKFREYIKMEGQEHMLSALKEGKGLILMAMHFGSWELASLSCGMHGYPYNVVVKPQKRFLKLNDLLNSYRSSNGNVVLSRGLGTRDMIKNLRNNEIIGLVVDQGGRDGVLVPFFGRQASMSMGAIRLGLRLDVPVCFSIIIRDKGPYHRMIVQPPLKLEKTGDTEKDVLNNLQKVVDTMQDYVKQYPSEYMWFYKIWKYSKESTIVILDDGKVGHLRQSQTVAKMVGHALADRNIKTTVNTVQVVFKNKFASTLMSIFSALVNSFVFQGRLEVLNWFLTPESFTKIMSTKADFIISCGSSVAGINYLLSNDQQAKSIAVLKPSFLNFRKFDMVVLPQHDRLAKRNGRANILVTKGAPNLITPEYLQDQSQRLLKKYSHLKSSKKLKIGLLLGGDTKEYILSEKQVKMVINQIRQVSTETNTDILITTSRRTSPKIESLLLRELKKYPRCQLLIIANRSNVPEAMGGILGLSDIVVVSGDSISMISEAASSGKQTIVFPAERRAKVIKGRLKHDQFIKKLNTQGYIISADTKNIGRVIYDVTKNKIKTIKLDDNSAILEAVKEVI